KLSALAARDPADQKLIREMHDRTGLDPLHDIASLLLAFPDDARRSGQFGMVVTGRSMDERRLITFARDQASLRGRDLSQRLHAGHRLWHDRTGGDLEGFFLNGSNFVLGRGGWAERIATLAPPDPVATPKPGPTSEPSAADNPELANLVARIRQA